MNKKLRKLVVLLLLGCLVCSPVFAEWKLSKGKNPILTYDGICLYTDKTKQIDKEKLDFKIKVTFDQQRLPKVEFIPKHSLFGNKKNLNGFLLWEVLGDSIYDYTTCDFGKDNSLYGIDALNLLNAVVINSDSECRVYKSKTLVYEFVVDNSNLESLLNNVNGIIDVPAEVWGCNYNYVTSLCVSIHRSLHPKYKTNYSDDYKIYSMKYRINPTSSTTRFYNGYEMEVYEGSMFLSFYCSKFGTGEDDEIKVLSTNIVFLDEVGDCLSRVELKPSKLPIGANNISYNFSVGANPYYLKEFKQLDTVGFVELQTTISCDGDEFSFTTRIPAEEFRNLMRLGWNYLL